MPRKTGVTETYPEVVGSSHARQTMCQGLIYQSHIEKQIFLQKQKKLEGDAKIWPFGGRLKKQTPLIMFLLSSEVKNSKNLIKKVTKNVIGHQITNRFNIDIVRACMLPENSSAEP